MIELPLKAMASNERKNYSPVLFKLDGYAQVPRQAAAPYSNNKHLTKHDAVAKRYLNKTAKFFNQARGLNRAAMSVNASAHQAAADQ